MPTPPLRHDFVDVRLPEPHELPAEEYNLNAVRTDLALDTADAAVVAAEAAQSTADEAVTAAGQGSATLTADLYVDFTDKPNGDPPAILDTGQTVTFVLENPAGRKPQVSGGRLVASVSGGGSYADYYQGQGDGDILTAGTRFTVNAADGTTQGVACLAAWDSAIRGSGFLIPKSPAHITVDTLTGFTAWWVNDGLDNTHLKAVKTWNITPPATNGVAIWELAFHIDPATGEGRLLLPGPVTSGAEIGQRVVRVTDAEIAAALTAQSVPVVTFAQLTPGTDVVMVEHQANATANTARMPRFIDMWGIETRVGRDIARELVTMSLLGQTIHKAAAKTTPVDNDEFVLADSEVTWGHKRFSWANIKARIGEYIAVVPQTLANKTLTAPKIGTIADTNGAAAINLSPTASAVNYLQVLNSAAGFPLGVRAAGTDTNIPLNIRGKGTGGVTIGTGNEPVMTTTSHLIDEDNFASNTDLKAPTQQSTKAYVDTQLGTKVANTDPRLSDARAPLPGSVGVAQLSATGTPNATTYLRGDNTWGSPASGGLTAVAAYVATAETTPSGGAYADLTTVTDTVTVDVGPTGVAIVFIAAWFGSNAANAQAYMSFATTGANVSAAADARCVAVRATASSAIIGATGATYTLLGLTPGSTTFKLKYKAAGGTGTFEHRRISVLTF